MKSMVPFASVYVMVVLTVTRSGPLSSTSTDGDDRLDVTSVSFQLGGLSSLPF